MIEFTQNFEIRAVGLKSKTKDGVSSKRMRLTIEKEFDDDLATALGSDAKRVRKLLSDGGLAKAEIPLDAVEARMKVKNITSARLTIDAVKGVSAKAKAPASVGGEMPPSIALIWDFAFSDDAVVFLANALGQTIEVEITPRQLELIKQETQKSPLVRAAAAQAAGTLSRELVEECLTYVEKRSEKMPVPLRAALARFKLQDGAQAPKGDDAPLANPVLSPGLAAELAGDDRAGAASPEDAEVARAERLALDKAEQRTREIEVFGEKLVADADVAMDKATYEKCEDDRGPYFIAILETPTSRFELEADTREAAAVELRDRVLHNLQANAGDEAPAPAAPPKKGLQIPKGVKAPKSHKSASRVAP